MIESAAPEAAESSLRWTISPVSGDSDSLRDWDALNQNTWDTPLLSSLFIRAALRHLGKGNERLAIAKREDRPAAMLLLVPISRFTWTTFQPSQLPLATILLATGEKLEKIVSSLFSALPPQVLALSILHLDSRFILPPGEAALVDVLPHLTTGAIDLTAGDTDYFESRPKSLRQNVKKRRNHATAALGKPDLQVLTQASDIDSFLTLYSSTESSGWKGRAGTAVRTDDEQGRFYCELLAQAADSGKARMFVLRFGNTSIAQQLAIDHAGVLYLMKTAHDEEYRRYAPGVLQRWEVLRWAAANGVGRVEIYGRLNDSQRPFITESRQIYHATCYRYRAARQIRDVLHRIRQPKMASIPANPPRPAPESKNDDSTVRTPFETASWFDLLENTCFARLPGRSVRVSASCDPDAYFPLWFRPGRMGGYLSGVSNFYTPLFMPTGTTLQKNNAVYELVRYLRETRGWSTLTLQPVANDAQWLTTLTAELRRVSMLFDSYHCFGNWYTNVSGLDVTSFENALSSRTRHTLARARRRVERDSDFKLILESGTVKPGTLQRCIDDFLRVYQHSWKQAEPYPDFIPGLFTLASDKGWLRYACLRYRDEPIASQLWLTHAGVTSIYKLAYDERYARYSPGSLLTQTMIRHAIDVDRVNEIDYLVGDDAYKQEWMKSRRVRTGMIVFNRACPGGLVEAARHYGRKNLKKLAPRLHSEKMGSLPFRVESDSPISCMNHASKG